MRFIFLFAVFCALAVSSAADSKPNVVIFLTDDQGWGDLSVNGNTNLKTPNIDSLARDGATLENFYVCAVCAPTRAEFLTGRYHPRTGVSGVSTGQGRLNYDETTIADVFRAAGYATGAFGKWHNGTQAPYHPNNRGFDEFYGFTSGHWGHYFSPPLDHNGEKVRGNGFVVDDFTDHAIEFIEEHQDEPFFCYVPYNTPHSPMMVEDNFYAKFAELDPAMKHRDPEKEDLPMTRAALAMCENIDWNVGRVLTAIDQLDLRENTIVIYFSDNGPNSFRWNGGMKGKKGAVDEGGVRSPFFIRWPGRIESGQNISTVTSALDLLPSLASMTKSELKTAKPLDGRDFSPMLFDSSEKLGSRDLFSLWGRKSSVRTERFRLDSGGQLFDITNDRGQRVNVADQFPEETARLTKRIKEFQEEMKLENEKNADRPFTVGFAESTTLPARDGVPHGGIERSSKAPNNSFFRNWAEKTDAITWEVEVGESGNYAAVVYYTCAETDVGVTIRLSIDNGDRVESKTGEAFDPPLYDKAKERVEKSHYFVKDFKPHALGQIELKKGRGVLSLTAPKIVGERAIDVHSIELIRQ
ncbi:MAG: arylsulfatase A-like enzyme [Verrucomicrobiales bacterium]|jgi:arylsulfatase A-like enzyme